MPNPSLLITSDKSSASPTQAEPPLFDWTTVHQTVLKFVNPLSCGQPIAAAVNSETLLAAMQRLIAIINLARLSPLAAPEGSLSEAHKLETLLPYVSEEAYDVLDALHAERQAVVNSPQPAISHSPQVSPFDLISPLPSPFTTIESLIPSLLWRLARSSYSAMHLIEGIRAKRWLPEQGWVCGMLRLVVMLEVEAPTIRWCFDLATGYPPELMLEPTAIVQSDESALPIRCTTIEASDASPCQVKHQLQAVLRQLQTSVSGLDTFLQGVAIELLQPGIDWQAGDLRLRLGFAFSTQIAQTDGSEESARHPELIEPELIEAELMEETVGLAQNSASQWPTAAKPAIAGLLSKTHVSVVNPVDRLLSPTTLVRLTETEALERYAQETAQQQCEQTLAQLRHQQITCGEKEAHLALIVQAAIDSCEQQLNTSGLELLHPMLLMDELVPNLLWSITSSTHDIMRLVGGISAQVLQPHAHWQRGTLRLLAALHLKATDVDYQLDLSTGRSIESDVVSLSSSTVVQINTAVGSQPTPITAVIDHLQQQLDETMFAYRLLKDGVSITWLEDIEQDWQTGTMKLSISLAFVADAL
ncbi:MAG: hypothetical protein KME45_12540 [Stenomitos rutilans HA7619-LM2]|jgi:hypothetical protein|nr:hypothetical protein [Stenomitos rutilans HA7619-LM2]